MSTEIKGYKHESKWYKLDNAAKIYPAISSPARGSVFRVAVHLYEDIVPQKLQEALNKTVLRFPAFSVKIEKGLFWYYFESNFNKPLVTPEKAPPCRAFHTGEGNGFLFRVIYFKKRISLEVFHALTDGTGAMAFLKALTFQYLTLLHPNVYSDENIIDCDQPPSIFEAEDSFKKYYNPKIKSSRSEDKAYQIIGTGVEPEAIRIVHGIIPLKSLLELVKEYNSTVTQYLTALEIYSIYNTQLKGVRSHMPIKISVPVNLRNFFPSNTLRNFSSYVNIGLTFTENDYTFEQVLETVIAKMKSELQASNLIGKISTNVNAERNIFMRIVPLSIKNVVLKTAFNLYGEKLFTSTLSNLGIISVSESMQKYIDRFEVILGTPVTNLMNSSVCSYSDKLVITFTKAMFETDIERFFFRFLAEKGLDIIIETN